MADGGNGGVGEKLFEAFLKRFEGELGLFGVGSSIDIENVFVFREVL